MDRHPRFVVDLNHDGLADIVGFGDAGVYSALGNGDGTFQAPVFGLGNFGYDQDWRVDRHPRFLAHLTSSGFADIVGFGEDGIWTALGNGDGTFRQPPHSNPVLHDFGYNQGWQVDRHPRCMATLTGSGFADIVGFGNAGVCTALSNGDGTFPEPNRDPVLENLGYNQDWRVDKHPRFVVDLNGNGFADIVGFGDAGVWTALGNGDGTFINANYVQANFGVNQGWRVDRHPRMVVSLNGSARVDIVGFGDAGIWTALGGESGGFPVSNFVQANFGYGTTVLALTQHDREVNSRGIWRSTDWGGNWVKVHDSRPMKQSDNCRGRWAAITWSMQTGDRRSEAYCTSHGRGNRHFVCTRADFVSSGF